MNDKLRTETLLIFFFGKYDNLKIAGVDRAFRDFSRTLRIKDYKETEYLNLKNKTSEIVLQKLSYLLTNKFSNQTEFNDFHKQVCEEIKKNWGQLTYGHIQKWVNMTLKYWLIIGKEYIDNIELNSKWFHIPIDNLILAEVFKEKYPKIPWSKIDYDTYFKYQLRFRVMISSDEIPIIEETKAFNKLVNR